MPPKIESSVNKNKSSYKRLKRNTQYEMLKEDISSLAFELQAQHVFQHELRERLCALEAIANDCFEKHNSRYSLSKSVASSRAWFKSIISFLKKK